MNADLLSTAAPYLAATRIALGLWLMLASVHWIAGASIFEPDGPIPWARLPGGPALRWVRRRMSPRLMRTWMGLHLALAVALLFATAPWLATACLAAALLSHGGFILLCGDHGASGADKIGLIVLAGTLIGTVGLSVGDAGLVLAGCLVSGGQLLLCYMVAGVSKLRQPAWRSGTELAGVMRHAVWGAPWAAGLVQRRGVALFGSWALMLGEALFPLALFATEPVLIAALGAMLTFHIATAIVMRLTLFPWAFAAAYPAVLLLGHVVRGSMATG